MAKWGFKRTLSRPLINHLPWRSLVPVLGHWEAKHAFLVTRPSWSGVNHFTADVDVEAVRHGRQEKDRHCGQDGGGRDGLARIPAKPSGFGPAWRWGRGGHHSTESSLYPLGHDERSILTLQTRASYFANFVKETWLFSSKSLIWSLSLFFGSFFIHFLRCFAHPFIHWPLLNPERKYKEYESMAEMLEFDSCSFDSFLTIQWMNRMLQGSESNASLLFLDYFEVICTLQCFP